VALVRNSSTFIDNGMITYVAESATIQDQSWIFLKVADAGIGVTEERLGKLFEEFS
jgi:signal transduction histidine kinase